MASVTYDKCIMANVIMANVIMAKIFMAKIFWQMKLSPSFKIRYTSIKNRDRCESGVPTIQILFNNGLVLNRFIRFYQI